MNYCLRHFGALFAKRNSAPHLLTLGSRNSCGQPSAVYPKLRSSFRNSRPMPYQGHFSRYGSTLTYSESITEQILRTVSAFPTNGFSCRRKCIIEVYITYYEVCKLCQEHFSVIIMAQSVKWQEYANWMSHVCSQSGVENFLFLQCKAGRQQVSPTHRGAPGSSPGQVM
jgi:hypothetical protein